MKGVSIPLKEEVINKREGSSLHCLESSPLKLRVSPADPNSAVSFSPVSFLARSRSKSGRKMLVAAPPSLRLPTRPATTTTEVSHTRRDMWAYYPTTACVSFDNTETNPLPLSFLDSTSGTR